MDYQLVIDDFIGRWGYSKQYVRSVLSRYKGKHVAGKISSFGGELDHGLDMNSQFRDHGDVTVYLSGMVASSATVAAMGAKKVVMNKYAFFLVHKCSNFIDAWGSYNADQMQDLIDRLAENKKENDKIDVVLANLYADKCGKKVSDILDVLKAGRWLSAKEALDYGFIDEISDFKDDVKMDFTPELQSKMNAFGISLEGLPFGQTATDDEPKSLVSKIVNSIFKRGSSDEAPDEEPPKSSQFIDMKKFNAIAAILKVDSVQSSDSGSFSLTAEQLQSVEDRIAELEQSVKDSQDAAAEKDRTIESLTRQVNDLKEAPGADTSEIEESGKEDSVSASDLFNSIKSLL